MWGLFGGLMNFKMLVAMVLIASFEHVVFAAADFGPARVLPKGRYQVTFRFGETSHISEKFSESGSLQNPARLNQRFDKDFLLKNSPELGKLLKFLNKTYPNLKPGDQLDMGALNFEGDAAARYIVPQFSRGMTSKWSLGIALPFVDYKTSLRATSSGVNTSSSVLGVNSGNNGEMSDVLGKAQKLMANSVAAFNSISDNRGYKRVEPREDSIVADLIIGSSYQVFETPKFDIYFINLLTLPTGPKDDPDDLTDLNVFHKTSLKNTLYANYRPLYWVELGLGAYYTAQFQDEVVRRVPTSSEDALPEASTKELLDKDPGDKLGIETSVTVTPFDNFETGLGYDYETKQSDKYKGSRGMRYDLLENGTSTVSHIGRFKMSYTTLSSFVGGKSDVPYSITYAYSDIFSGKNVEREQTHEMLLKFYF